MSELPVPEVMVEIVEAALRLGHASIKDLPGCCEFEAGEWWVAVNGHEQPQRCSRGARVPGFHAYVEFNGWPAGLVSAAGGTLAAGTAANEASLLAALRAVQAPQEPRP
jgi:hypothetical protein